MGNRPQNPELWPAHYAKERARDITRAANRRREAGVPPRITLTPETRATLEQEKNTRISARKSAGEASKAAVAHKKANPQRRGPKIRLAGDATRRALSSTLLHKYGIDADQYDEMLAAQAGGCAICGGLNIDPSRRLSVDHDHTTGAVRALLCNSCNVSIGLMKESPERLKLAAAYLERHKGA